MHEGLSISAVKSTVVNVAVTTNLSQSRFDCSKNYARDTKHESSFKTIH
jgi:hypothetical protein